MTAASTTAPTTPGFLAEGLGISFGGLRAVSDFGLQIPPRAIYGLIGPNGAGKTTCFNLITGVYRPDSGRMFLGETSLLGLKPFEITRAGLARTFQNIRLFAGLSVLENVLVSYHMRRPYGYFDSILRTSRFHEGEALLEAKALELLELMGLKARASDVARSLSYGDQRRLEIARALATEPKLLFLDEPAAGLNSQEKVQLMQTIAAIRDRFGLSILLIEHDMKLVMGVCERIVVLDHGETIASGTPKEIQSHARVIEAYLGGV